MISWIIKTEIFVILDMINAISAADIAFIMSSSQAIDYCYWIDWMLSTNQIFHSESDV